MKYSISLFFLIFSCNSLFAQTEVVINEFMASNDSLSTIVDDFDEADDWVELFNQAGASADLGGYFLSDDLSLLDKWVFPAGISIDGNGYLIVWTDKDDEQGDLHTSFKLSAAGEQIVLSSPTLEILDSISYGLQTTNISMSRIPNGTGAFIPQAPTFNTFNSPDNTSDLISLKSAKMAPNPASNYTQVALSFTESVNEIT